MSVGDKGQEAALRALVAEAIARAKERGADETGQLQAAASVLRLVNPELKVGDAVWAALRLMEKSDSQAQESAPEDEPEGG